MHNSRIKTTYLWNHTMNNRRMKNSMYTNGPNEPPYKNKSCRAERSLKNENGIMRIAYWYQQNTLGRKRCDFLPRNMENTTKH